MKLFEKLWIAAIVLSIIVAIYNAIRVQQFNNKVYMPIICAILCFFLWRNLRSQRLFSEKMNDTNSNVDK